MLRPDEFITFLILAALFLVTSLGTILSWEIP